MNKLHLLLSLFGACIGGIIFLVVLWHLAPLLMALLAIIGVFMLIGYFKEAIKHKDQ